MNVFAEHQAAVNDRLAREGRCVMHNTDVTIPAAYLVALPIGNVIPLCTDCLGQWLSDATETGDPLTLPVSYHPLGDRSE